MKPIAEPDDGSLRALSTPQPDAMRAARTRERCRSALQRRARVDDPVAPGPPIGGGRRRPKPAELAFRNALAGAVGLLCLVYLVALITITVNLR
jgi:hypothetical protein